MIKDTYTVVVSSGISLGIDTRSCPFTTTFTILSPPLESTYMQVQLGGQAERISFSVKTFNVLVLYIWYHRINQ